MHLNSATGRDLAGVIIASGSTTVTLFGFGPAAYTGNTTETRTIFQWQGPPPGEIQFRLPHTQRTFVGTIGGNMSLTPDAQFPMLYETLASASPIDAVLGVDDVATAGGVPVQLTTNNGLITWDLSVTASRANSPTYIGTLIAEPYHN